METREFILEASGRASRQDAVSRIASILDSLPCEAGFAVTVREYKATRSERQNRYLWGAVYTSILKQGGEALAGWHAEELHEYCLGECYGWEELRGFKKRKLRPKHRSSSLSKAEFAHFVAFIQQHMAEHGIVVPDPDPEFLHQAAA